MTEEAGGQVNSETRMINAVLLGLAVLAVLGRSVFATAEEVSLPGTAPFLLLSWGWLLLTLAWVFAVSPRRRAALGTQRQYAVALTIAAISVALNLFSLLRFLEA